MEKAEEPLKILLLHQTGSKGESGCWASLAKALGSLAEMETQDRTEAVSFAELESLASEGKRLFVDLALQDPSTAPAQGLAAVTFVAADSFPWNDPGARSHFLPALSAHSCLVLGDTPATDLLRILHLYLSPKRLTGVSPLMEKGSTIIGEKVQSLDTLGCVTDKMAAFLHRIEGFPLKGRIADLRQTLAGILAEAFHSAAECKRPYPTVDFQVGVNQKKASINLRFPRGNLRLEELSSWCLEGKDLFWQQIWLCSDHTLVTHHTQYDELEIMLLVNRATRARVPAFRSLLFKTSDRSMKKDSLTSAPSGFEFRLLSDIRLSESDQSVVLGETKEEIDFGSLPEPVLQKLSKLQEESAFLKEKAEARERQMRELGIKVAQLNKDILQSTAVPFGAQHKSRKA